MATKIYAQPKVGKAIKIICSSCWDARDADGNEVLKYHPLTSEGIKSDEIKVLLKQDYLSLTFKRA